MSLITDEDITEITNRWSNIYDCHGEVMCEQAYDDIHVLLQVVSDLQESNKKLHDDLMDCAEIGKTLRKQRDDYRHIGEMCRQGLSDDQIQQALKLLNSGGG